MKSILVILSLFLSTSALAEVTIRDCAVTAVRRLNVSNGVEIQLSGCYVNVGNFNRNRLRSVRIVEASEAIVAQMTTLATSALANNLCLEFLFESHQLECDRNYCDGKGFDAMEVYRPNGD